MNTRTKTNDAGACWRDRLCCTLFLLGIVGLAGCDPRTPPPGLGSPNCGGIAAIECPGAGECVDDPADGCDPSAGGADCSGTCTCNTLGLCEDGYVWDGSAQVCGCIKDYDPCIAAICPVGTKCTSDDGAVECVPFDAGVPGDGETCGDTVCNDGMVCCNASCGICTGPGGACIQLECTD